MTRPPLEVADLVRTAGTAFIERNRQWLRWTHIKVLLAITRCRTAALGGHIDECTRCGHRAAISITVVAIAIARSVRPALANAGSRHVAAHFCPRPTSMWFSLCLRNWLRWLCRTRKSSMVCCCAPAQKLYSKWLATPGISAPRSASSVCYTHGDEVGVSGSRWFRTHCGTQNPPVLMALAPNSLWGEVFRGRRALSFLKGRSGGKIVLHPPGIRRAFVFNLACVGTNSSPNILRTCSKLSSDSNP